jgi:hypothetical protein
MSQKNDARRWKTWTMGLLLATTALTSACGQDPLARKYEGTFALDLQTAAGPQRSEGTLGVGFNVYNDTQAVLTMNKLVCTLSATYVGDLRAPNEAGKKVSYEELRDVRPDQILVCPVPAELGENQWLEFRLGTGRIEDGNLRLAYSGDVWQGSSPDLADARGTKLGTFRYSFEGSEVAAP